MSQADTCDITVPISTADTYSGVCTSPWFIQRTEYRPRPARYEYLINGEVAFKAVHKAIAEAERSIDIICWGFQPSMFFIRDGEHPSIGDLLNQKAAEGKQVRVLGWEAPFNSAGVGGEANLPGKGGPKDRAGQTSTDKQFAQDRQWYKDCASLPLLGIGTASRLRKAFEERKVPVFVGRGFGLLDRAEIAWRAKYRSMDSDLGNGTVAVLAGTPTHHQKSVLIDYELPDKAVGFVMGHNMLDAYWDTDSHSSKLRPSGDPKCPSGETNPPDLGPRGKWPRQDISCKVSGPILAHLHHNFATAWKKETGEDLIVNRNAVEVAGQLSYDPAPKGDHGELVMAQLLRTQAQEGKSDIERLYLRAVNNATQFIYIENQYFRWPPLAKAILKTVKQQTVDGRKSEEHGTLYLFVITNASEEGIGPGTVNTQRTLDILGRADTIPEVTKLMRGEKVEKKAKPDPKQCPEPISAATPAGAPPPAQEDMERDEQPEGTVDTPYGFENRPGLKVHVCSLVAPDSPSGRPWMPVYIHSKLMIVNDVFTTHGSANINTRSMQVDSELNIAHERHDVSQKMRRELWNLHTAGIGAQDDPQAAFKQWGYLIGRNKGRESMKSTPYASLIEFRYDEPSRSNID